MGFKKIKRVMQDKVAPLYGSLISQRPILIEFEYCHNYGNKLKKYENYGTKIQKTRYLKGLDMAYSPHNGDEGAT